MDCHAHDYVFDVTCAHLFEDYGRVKIFVQFGRILRLVTVISILGLYHQHTILLQLVSNFCRNDTISLISSSFIFL